MPTISGHVFYSPDNTLTPNSGIQNVPVVLYNAGGAMGATALSDSTGAYVFTNVPAGNYQIVEAWGALGGIPSPVDYSLSAVSMPSAPIEKEPPLSALTQPPPALADFLMAISPNLLNITLGSMDLTGQDFYDAPVGSKPVVFNGITMVGNNLITAAANGSFGSVPAGSFVNTIPPIAPYPLVTPGLPYVPAPEIPDGSYSIVNIRRRVDTTYAWWNLSDHETMLETGRFMFVNGDMPGAILFRETVLVSQNTDYTVTGWGLNLLNTEGVPPKFAVEIIAADGSMLGFQEFNSLQSTAIPIWYQAGFLFNSGSNNSVTVRVLSEAPFSLSGNDYAIDEIRMYQAAIQDLLSLEKSFTRSILYAGASAVGMTSTVNVIVKNTSALDAPNTVFQDVLDPRIQFVSGSVQINGSGVGFETADPNSGFSIGNLSPNATVLVSFDVTSLIAGPDTIPNTANASYDAAKNGNGDIIRNTVNSNEADLVIVNNTANLAIHKMVDLAYATPGDILTYTISLTNTGTVSANNVVLIDSIPTGTTYVNGSLNGATGFPPTFTLNSPIPAKGSVTVTFQVQVENEIPMINPIPNVTSAKYDYTIDPTNPNGASGTNESNIVYTLINKAIVSAEKNGTPLYANVGDTITYTITLMNSGNVAANNVTLIDVLPTDTTFVPGSLVGAHGTPPDLSLNSPIPAGGSVLVSFDVVIADSLPNPNPLINNVVVNYTYTIDPSKPNEATGTTMGGPAITQVNTATLVVDKSVDTCISYINDIITYQIQIQNMGNVNADKVTLIDLLPSGVSYVLNSLTVSEPYSGTLQMGLLLTNPIIPNQMVTLTFQAKIDAIPNPNPITNQVNATYSYTVDPQNPDAIIATSKSNIVLTTVFRYEYVLQITDLITSVALEEASLAAIAQEEGAKIQKMITLKDVTSEELLCINKSVSDMMETLSLLEAILKQKLEIVDCQIQCTLDC